MSQSEAERGRGREREGEEEKDLLTFTELRFSSEGKKKWAPIASGASAKLHHQRRTIAGRAGTCGRQLTVCQKRKGWCAHRFNFVKFVCATQLTKAAKGVSKKRAAHVRASGTKMTNSSLFPR